MNIGKFQKLANKLYLKKVPFLPKIIFYLQFLLFNSSVPYKCKFGKNVRFAYGGIGVVIHERVVIGNNCIIGQGITIGGKSKVYEVPIIGDNVYIAAGVRIIGNVKIGNNIIIGANSVVVKDIPDGCIVAGVPGKIIKRGIKMEDYV
jgi:serine O-acetyltransferase